MIRNGRITGIAKKLFFLLAIITLFLMLITANFVGATGDEVIDGANGKYCLEYYCSGDTTFADYSKVPEVGIVHMKYYGIGFEILPAILMKVFDLSSAEYLIRHLLNALFGFIFILFAGLIGRELKDWNTGVLALGIMILSPIVFGLSFFDSKDIPMAAGFSIATFFSLRFYKHLPLIRWYDVVGIMMGIALAVSIRIGGLLFVFYFGAGLLFSFLFRKELFSLIKNANFRMLFRISSVCLAIVCLGTFLGLCAYPNFFYEGAVSHVTNAFAVVSKFKQRIPMLFEGEIIESTNLPPLYLLKSYLTTIPVFAWLGIVLFGIFIRSIFKKYDKTALCFLVLMTIFPFAYISWTEAVVYNGWRHTIFIYSSFAVLSAIGIQELSRRFKTQNARSIYWGVVLLTMLPTLWWMCSNYKYTYAYYNLLIPNPYCNYDMDYYETSSVVAYQWLLDNHRIDSNEIVAVKNHTVQYYSKSTRDSIRVAQLSFRGYAEVDCDYAILSINFIPPQVLKKFFPPRGTIHTECIDGNPICAVVKRENKYDTQGIRAIQTGNWDSGMVLLEKAYQYDPNNFGIWFWMGYGYLHQQKYKEAIDYFRKYLTCWPAGEQLFLSYALSGQAFLESNSYEKAIETLKMAENMASSEENKAFVYVNMGLAYYHKKDFKKAIPYFESIYHQYPGMKEVLYDCYTKTGDKIKAGKLLSKASNSL